MRGRDNHILLSVFHNSTIRYVAPMQLTIRYVAPMQAFAAWDASHARTGQTNSTQPPQQINNESMRPVAPIIHPGTHPCCMPRSCIMEQARTAAAGHS